MRIAFTEAQRSDMKAKIDALVAHAYELKADETAVHLYKLHPKRRSAPPTASRSWRSSRACRGP